MAADPIFEPLQFRNLAVKNRIFRSNISGRFDNYDGTGTPARINWEEKFARGGVGAIISSYSPVAIRGRILPGYATISDDDRIPFWRKVGERVHSYDCRYIIQLSHSGRQQDLGGIENFGKKALSSTSQTDSLHGFECQAMTVAQIHETVQDFADAAGRAREAGLDGVELHGANGYLITQFLSSAINDRVDEYGGSLENRARFVLEIIRAIRQRVGADFHLQMKISAVDYGDAIFPWEKKGTTLAESIEVVKWIEQAGADAIHVSTGNIFPHPLNPAGDLPLDVLARTYNLLLANGDFTFRNYVMFRYPIFRPIFSFLWNRTRGKKIEGINVEHARAIKSAVSVPVICTGGFQTASYIRRVISDGSCDAVSIARSLIANNDLVQQFAGGLDRPTRPCTYCNKCLANVVANPLGCYEVSRFDGDYDAMMREVMSVFHPTGFETPSPELPSAAPSRS